MFRNPSSLGCLPLPPNQQQQNKVFSNVPLNMPSVLSQQQIISVQLSFQSAVRLSEENTLQNDKRQRLHTHYYETTVDNRAVPLQEKHRYSFPEPVKSLLFCAPPVQDILFLYPRETTFPVAKDKLSHQVLEWFQACQQQICDLNSKELCRAELQREIRKIFPRSRLFLVGSTMNGFGTHSSDGDLCLVLKEPVNQKTEAMYILSLIQKHFATELSRYIERPQLIRAKVPIVKFRDKVSSVEFDLNVNNVVGIRNTFLLRTYACVENRVRPLVVVVKKWASFHEINDASRGTLNSYSLVLMVLHYLQTLPEPILPSLQKNYPESFDPALDLYLVHQLPCTIPPYISKNGSSLGDLLIGFLKYYATEFDWRRQIISVREAKAIPRPDDTEWRNKFICIEEPFDGTNTARAVHEKQKFNIIRSEFLESWKVLRDKKDLNYILPLEAVLQKR
ncbi:poly(A) RNA polymerase GLD2 isoform X2 [Indicator indicator]|uniref:poly(A) RNA polymerase GLD2 isoform X2 n=1 Tax=Indicator indicator TaxID=1002788 RepID=UPI0023E00577|nr:poly(A) RNA polymerase GLD2 isoform X2 [Indicator indicator]